jgi:hypothetical protein
VADIPKGVSLTEPINLNRVRKAKARTEAQASAARNRVAFGRTKAEKLAAKAETEAGERRLDQTRREP